MIKLSVDDGCASDTRVAELARRYKIETVFYWPIEWHSLALDKGYEPLSFGRAKVIAREFEIGAHTITHRHLTRIPFLDAFAEIAYSKYMLQKLFGVEVTKFCPPRGYMNEILTDFALFYFDEIRLTKAPGLVHIHPESGANDGRNWVDCIDENTTELWCHSWELDKFNLWAELEGVMEMATAGSIA